MLNDMPASTYDLLQQARAGDARAMESLLERHREFVRLLVRCRLMGRLRARLDSSDVIQETLLRVAENFQQFQGASVEEWRAWLTRIAEREIVRQWRHHLGTAKRAVTREQQPAAGHGADSGESLLQRWFINQTSPSLAAMRKERALLLAAALASLPDDYREVLILRDLEGLDFPEAARRMKRSPGAVRVLWTRALKRLREELSKTSRIE